VRCNVFHLHLGVAAAFRVLPSRIFTVEDLGLPPQLAQLTELKRGLVIVTGPPGSGKSTTLAALLDHINRNQRKHILTIEDPIEYRHVNAQSMITHREVGRHAPTFARALRAALREDPDVIMVGEMRDLETISLAITAAETGHLVLATLHTANASRTLARVLDVFPPKQQEHVRVMVAESLRGVISHQLIPRKDGTGRVLALEILTNKPAVANVIRENKTYLLPGIIQTGKKQGMRLMDDALMNLYENDLISAEEVYARADQKHIVRQHLKL
jgi:twitching motility protein PilT